MRPDLRASEANLSQVCVSCCRGSTSERTLSSACHTSTLRCTPFRRPRHMALVRPRRASASASVSPSHQGPYSAPNSTLHATLQVSVKVCNLKRHYQHRKDALACDTYLDICLSMGPHRSDAYPLWTSSVQSGLLTTSSCCI